MVKNFVSFDIISQNSIFCFSVPSSTLELPQAGGNCQEIKVWYNNIMKLEFKINKTYLLVHALKQQILPFPEWVGLKNYLWKMSPQGYEFLIGSPEIFLKISNSKEVDKIIRKSFQLIKKGIKRKEFRRLYQETKEYKSWLEKEWQQSKNKILKWISEISRLKLPSKTITVFVTHPKLLNGKILTEKSIICWGHPEDWKNYSVVYLTHELMHIITKEKLNSHIMHALIELMVDNEIRIRLNKKGKYFKEGKFNVGHDYLLPIEKKILPEWKKFLMSNKKNLFQLEREIKKKVDLNI